MADDRRVPAGLLAAAATTLRRLGPRQFSLTAVAEAAGVSRGTVHNALGSRDNAIRIALDHLASTLIDTMAAEVSRQPTLADQVAAAAVLVCAHRQCSEAGPGGMAPRTVAENLLVLLLGHIGDDLLARSLQLWQPLVRAAQHRGEVRADTDATRAGEWIVRMLLSFEVLPPMGVNLGNPRAVHGFVADHIVAGLGDTAARRRSDRDRRSGTDRAAAR